MDGAPREWWQRVFDGSYRRIYAFMERHTERDLAFLKDVLELRPGMSLLDMCCGYGRHSIPLAEMGLRVMGVDYSSEQLAEARRRARARGAEVTWIRADGRALRTPRRFDRAINMFTAFGFFETEEDDAGLMRAMARVLKPGGVLCLDTINRDYIMARFHPTVAFPVENGHVVDTNSLDLPSGRLVVSRAVYGWKRPVRYRFSIRLYTARELILMAGACGLDVTELYGTLEKAPLSTESPRVVLIARKP